MRLGNVPCGLKGSLVEMQSDMHRHLHFVERPLELKISRCVVNGVTRKNQQDLNLAALHVCREFAKRLQLVNGVQLERVCVEDGFPDVSQGGVHGVRKHVNIRRLMLAGNNEARTLVRIEIARNRRKPGGVGTACAPWGSTNP